MNKTDRNKFIAIVGSDGSGKTTVADLLEKSFIKQSKYIYRQHWRPYLLPSPRKLVGQKVESDPTKPHCKSHHSRVISTVLLFYYFSDFWIGYLINLLPRLWRGHVVLAERYIYDIVMDPLRHRLDVPSCLSSVLCKAVPQPDIIIFLYGEPHVLRKRKQELTVDEIQKQQDRMFNYSSCLKNFVPLNVTCASPDDILCEIKTLLSS